MTSKIKFDVYKQGRLQKCNMCDRVKQLVYKITMYDNKTIEDVIVSELQSCKGCGNNLYNIINPNSTENPDEFVKKSFTFTK